jgi:hypothetical protein
MPKRKATSKISGLVSSDDEDLMQMHTKEETEDTHEEPPAKKRRGRPRTSNETVTETKPTKPTTRAKKQQAVSAGTEAPTEKKPARRGRPGGSSHVSQDAEPPATAQTEDMEPENTTQDQENINSRTSKTAKIPPTKATKAKAAPAATRGRGQGRAASVAKQFQIDGEFEFTPSGTRHTSAPETQELEPSPLARGAARGRKVPEVEETQQHSEPAAELVEDSVLPEPSRLSMSPAKNRSRVSMLRNPQDSPRKRKLGADSELGGDPELRRRLGELTKKHDALEIKYRNLREIGIVEANTNMEKLRKQSETVITGMSYNDS